LKIKNCLFWKKACELNIEMDEKSGDIVKRIMKAAQIEVGGVEYLINSRDGQVYYYDINALSNFVADAPNVIGFNPFPRLVDFLLARAGLPQSAIA